MPTPSIQTLVTDAQQILNLDSISAVRSVVAVALANANTGTPLNPNLTTQQLWNEFYQVVNKPKSDIESIIANQLMKFLFAPPAPGGVGANGQVIFNDGGVLAGDPQFLWNKTTNLLTITGSATITGDLTVDTNVLKVDTTLNKVGIGVATLTGLSTLNVAGDVGITSDLVLKNGSGTAQGYIFGSSGLNYRVIAGQPHVWQEGGSDLMRLNSTGLGVGVSPSAGRLHIKGGASQSPLVLDTLGYNQIVLQLNGANRGQIYADATNCFALVDSTGSNSRLLVTDSGNVGISVTPSAWASTYRALQIGIGTSLTGITNDVDVNLVNNARFDGTNWKYTNSSPAERYRTASGTHYWYNAASGTAGNNITWTPAMTLTDSNELLLKYTTTSGNAGAVAIRPGSSGQLILVADSGGLFQQVTSNYYLVTTAGGSTSDATLKKNVQQLSGSLAKVCAIRGVNFEFIETPKCTSDRGVQLGVIAQEVEAQYPEIVVIGDDGKKSVRYDRLVAPLIEAIKELTARVQTLEAK